LKIVTRRTPESLLIVPTLTYLLGSEREHAGPLNVIHSFDVTGLAKVYMVHMGAFGIFFHPNGSLASIPVLQYNGRGRPPAAVTASQQLAMLLQERRLVFAAFIAAAVFGHYAARTKTTLTGARHSGLEAVVPITLSGLMRPGRVYDDGLSIAGFGDDVVITITGSEDFDWLMKIMTKKFSKTRGDKPRYIGIATLRECAQYVQDLVQRGSLFGYADLQAIIGMNYQAAILHRLYHTAASLALNLMVLEVLTKELFFSYGLVGNTAPQSYAAKPHRVEHLSNNKFKKMTFAQQLDHLKVGGLLDTNLAERIDVARLKRNRLMHRGEVVTSTESLACQTAVRDLWPLLIPMRLQLMG
jgi:hypothetical protein